MSNTTNTESVQPVTDDPHVAIIILNYNGREQLQEYLPSVLSLDYGNYEVIVVDNDSSDGSVQLLREEFPEVTVVRNDDNVGFSRGNNIGADEAPDAEYLWFLNTDVRTEPSSLSLLIEYMETAPEPGIAVPRINFMDDSGMIQSVGFDLEPQWIPKGRDKGQYEPSNPDPHPVTYGSGAALLVDRDVWEDIGGFDDGNFIFGDDIYLCLLAWIRGYRVDVVPESVVYHEEGASRKKIPAKVAYHEGRSHTRAFLKLMQVRSLVFGFPGFVLYGLYRTVGDVVLRNSVKAALYRVAGHLSPLKELGSLYEERREIQRDRRREDGEFLTEGQLSTLRSVLDVRRRHPSPADE